MHSWDHTRIDGYSFAILFFLFSLYSIVSKIKSLVSYSEPWTIFIAVISDLYTQQSLRITANFIAAFTFIAIRNCIASGNPVVYITNGIPFWRCSIKSASKTLRKPSFSRFSHACWHVCELHRDSWSNLKNTCTRRVHALYLSRSIDIAATMLTKKKLTSRIALVNGLAIDTTRFVFFFLVANVIVMT